MDTTDPNTGAVDTSVIDSLRETLCQHASLFDEPNAYTAGVHDAIDALTGLLPEVTS